MTLYKIVHRQEGHEPLYWKRNQDPSKGDRGEFVAESEGMATPFPSETSAKKELYFYATECGYGYENIKVEKY